MGAAASPLVAALRNVLQTHQEVRLAVLYGSLARGDQDTGSDLDLLVSLMGDRDTHPHALVAELEGVGARKVDIARLERVEARAPLLLHRALQEGLVLVDRDGQWRVLHEKRKAIQARAQREYRQQMAAAGHAIEELTR
jgi:predicted nucleotidyltransferase